MSDDSYANTIRILVVGEEKVGKTCLISSFCSLVFKSGFPPVLPPVHIDASYTDIGISLVLSDTSSRDWRREKWEAELQQTDVIILCYACDDALTLKNVTSHWLPFFRTLEINVPIILTKCKSDLTIDNVENVEAEVKLILEEHPEIDSYIECSGRTRKNVYDVFHDAQMAAVYPRGILFDVSKGCLKPSCERALKRIFIYFDKDDDGMLNNAELSNFQVTCFGETLNNAEILSTRKFLEERFPEGVNWCGITFKGFIFLHIYYIKQGQSVMPWTCLRKFGYDFRIQIRESLLPTSLAWNSHQRVGLAKEAITFLRRTFTKFDVCHEGALGPAKIDELFSTAPESPWTGGDYVDAAESTVIGELTLNGFLSLWALMTLRDPAGTFANLKYIGYEGDWSSAFHVSKRTGLFLRWDPQGRNVFQCFVFGPRKAGKSAILNQLIGRPFLEEYVPTTQQHSAANVINLPRQEQLLVMTEIPSDELSTQLMNQDFLAVCDIAIFVYDSSDEYSWTQVLDIFRKVSEHGEEHGLNVPCLFVAAKSDLVPKQFIQEDSSRVCNHMNIQPPIFINLRTRENNIFQTILLVAQRPGQIICSTKQRGFNFIFYSLSAVGATILGLAVRHVCNKNKLKDRGDHR